MSTVRSSVGEELTWPDVPTAVEFDAGLPPPRIEKKLTPVNMLNSATTMKPPMPRWTMPKPPPPDAPRMSSMSLRFPGVQRIAPPRPEQCSRRASAGRGMNGSAGRRLENPLDVPVREHDGG